MKYETIIFDFDGVLCHDRFYSNLTGSHPEVFNFIQSSVFGEASDIPHKWMRGEMTMSDVNKYISDHTNIDFEDISRLFVESVKQMAVDRRLLALASRVVNQGGKVALVTDNMDVFSQITIVNHKLDEMFPVIVNSSDYGILKKEKDGELFRIAFQKLDITPFTNTLLIDDSAKTRLLYEDKGGATFPFRTYADFEPWMKENLLESAANTII